MQLLLLIAYKRTGKNKLYEIISKEDVFNDPNRIRYRAYTSKNIHESLKIARVLSVLMVDASFAGALKVESLEEVRTMKGYENATLEEMDAKKDEKLFNNGTRSFRDICIDSGYKARQKDINHWAKKVCDNMKTSTCVTDCRYNSEVGYAKNQCKNNFNEKGIDLEVYTIRIFRKDVEIPDKSIESEHDLDEYETDFVLIPEENHDEEYKKLIEVFPQYSTYVNTWCTI